MWAGPFGTSDSQSHCRFALEPKANLASMTRYWQLHWLLKANSLNSIRPKCTEQSDNGSSSSNPSLLQTGVGRHISMTTKERKIQKAQSQKRIRRKGKARHCVRGSAHYWIYLSHLEKTGKESPINPGTNNEQNNPMLVFREIQLTLSTFLKLGPGDPKGCSFFVFLP